MTGVKLEKIRKGRILADFGDIWREFGETLPLHELIETTRKNKEKRETIEKRWKT